MHHSTIIVCDTCRWEPDVRHRESDGKTGGEILAELIEREADGEPRVSVQRHSCLRELGVVQQHLLPATAASHSVDRGVLGEQEAHGPATLGHAQGKLFLELPGAVVLCQSQMMDAGFRFGHAVP